MMTCARVYVRVRVWLCEGGVLPVLWICPSHHWPKPTTYVMEPGALTKLRGSSNLEGAMATNSSCSSWPPPTLLGLYVCKWR
jgi:hypothetical protein